MPTIEINGALYEYVDRGKGAPTLLLHGFMGSADSWQKITSHLSLRRRVIAVSLLGHGLSASPNEPGRYSFEQIASDLASFLTALDAKPADLIGYSMGARLALFFAFTYPKFVNKLILESGSPGLKTRQERNARTENDAQLAARLMQNGVSSFVEEWENLPLFASQFNSPTEMLVTQRKQRLKNNPTGLANSLRGMGTGSQPSLWEDLNQISVPTLLIAGVLDGKYCAIAERMARTLPAATLKIVPDAGHNVHLEQFDAYTQLVEIFLQG